MAWSDGGRGDIKKTKHSRGGRQFPHAYAGLQKAAQHRARGAEAELVAPRLLQGERGGGFARERGRHSRDRVRSQTHIYISYPNRFFIRNDALAVGFAGVWICGVQLRETNDKGGRARIRLRARRLGIEDPLQLRVLGALPSVPSRERRCGNGQEAVRGRANHGVQWEGQHRSGGGAASLIVYIHTRFV